MPEQSACPQRVAFDLMLQIAGDEKRPAEERTREYWLTLYVQCHKATNGQILERVLSAS